MLGPQLKPLSRVQPPRHLSIKQCPTLGWVWKEGWRLKGKKQCDTRPWVFLRHIPLLFTAQEADFPEVSVCLKNHSWTGGFPGSSAGKESSYNAGDPDLIPGSGRCPGEGKGYPLQYSWASLMAQLVKIPPAMREAWVQSLGWANPLEEGMAPTPVSMPEESPWKG